jgi:hypothetical protein
MEDSTLQTSALNQSPKRSKFLFLFIVGIVIIVVGFGAWQFFGVNTEKPEEQKTTPTPTEFKLPTDTPTPEAKKEEEPINTPTPEPTSTPKPKPTSDPVDKATGLDRSELSIEAQNGSGIEGAAGEASDTLKAFGYDVVSIGNADNFDYENIVIQVKSTKSEFLSLLKKDLGTSYTIGTTSADLSTSSSADALVIIGK